jgi:hypothetical protein
VKIISRHFSRRRCEGRSSGFERVELAIDNGGVDSREYRVRLQSDRIWEEHSGGWRRR